MLTSYFANKKVKNPVAISRIVPPKFKGGHYPILSPSYELLNDYKNDKITTEQYIERFVAQLELLNPKFIWDDLHQKFGDDITLVCYEGKGKFCHRHIVAIWFEEFLGIKINEL